MPTSDGTRRWWATLSESISSRIWPLPVAAIIAAVIAGILLPILDAAVDDVLPAWLAAILFSGGTDAARAVLTTIAGSLITATSLTFSLTVVALQLASNQASPRLLRTFASDRMVHVTLATFLGTFAYALTVLRSVSDTGELVPRIAVTVAFVLTLVSVLMLVLFLAHLASRLRVETMLRDVHRETTRTIALVGADDRPTAPAPVRPAQPHVVLARRSGFVTGIDRDAVVAAARDHGAVVRELRQVGASVIEGTPIAEWWPTMSTTDAAADRGTRADRSALEAAVAGAYHVGYERTSPQDIGFGLRQLADIAAKALSPGVNDPTTAVHALSHIAAVLGDLADLPEGPPAYADDDGAARVVPVRHDFAELVEVGMQQVRRYGAADPDVATRLFELVGDVGCHASRPEHRRVLEGQLDRLVASVAAADYDAHERAGFARLEDRARDVLAQADPTSV
ncbi:DUF2254 domain-containing protein [Agromyces kandeliae]|uniref:DUF2254 domain-containing protein n=1 Tax=Agromyces kandeliae TaxID=2666141 RepID=A0A6L5QZ11_9MICO|nr:DUF2254 domain-containing protein [Agromyces kandeliae]MRX43042.1 DUF2254 domain-containing protein [Agromyces kandeliae]